MCGIILRNMQVRQYIVFCGSAAEYAIKGKSMTEKIKKSFINSLMAVICLFNIILIVLFVLMTYYMTRNYINKNVQTQISNSATTAVRLYEDYISKVGMEMQVLSANPSVRGFFDGGEADDAVGEIANLMAADQNISNVWLMAPDGRCTDRGGLVTEDVPGILDIYVPQGAEYPLYSVYDKYLGLVVCRSYPAGEGRYGTVYMALNINRLGTFIGSSLTTDGAYFSLYDRDGNNIYAAPDIGSIMEDSGITTEAIGKAPLGTIETFKSGKGKIDNYYINRLSSSGWIISVVYDGKVANGDFFTLYAQQLVVLICLFGLELIATLNAIRYQARDIPKISSSIAEISAGNYNFRINSSAENEIGLIARSVDSLAQSLQDKNAEIEDYINVDATTGLYNRYKMFEYIKDLAATGMDSDRRFALIFVDIDNFKWVTETLGHKQGDAFLREFGQRLKKVVPKVFRFSGDEFVIVTDVADDYGKIAELIVNLKQQFKEPIQILSSKLYAQFSAGIAVYPDDDTDLDMLLRDSDVAMQRAKEKGKGRTEYFSRSFHESVVNKAAISQQLNKAISKNEMYLVFQPIISVDNMDIHGFEALIRWQNEDLGYVPPSSFIEVAEETGAIVEIGSWIFEHGCLALKKMNELNPDVIMSINVSAIQLKKSNFMDKVRRTISIFDINPKNLQIEITETSIVDIVDDDSTKKKLQQLSDMGIALALDDFGTGYSSLQYLKDMPIKTLKVDKSFVDEIVEQNKDLQITGSIIDMVRNLGIKTVVEGVESLAQYKILSELKCDYIQGFLMSKPLNEKDAMEFVTEYEELHRPSEQSLRENSDNLERERKMRGKK